MEKSLTCLVTGGAGFIGSHLCGKLLSKSYNVVCVDNLITGNKKNISSLLNNPNFLFIQHDITKPLPPNFKRKISNVKFLYHLASPASPIQYQKYSIETMLTNSIGTYNTLEMAASYNAKFLLASTSEVYGDPKEHPQKETYWGNVNPVGKRSCYDESKRFAESLTMEFIRKRRLNGRIVRIFNTYGPHMEKNDGRVISNFITQALSDNPLTVYGDGKQTRSFCYVSDMVDGIILMLEKDVISGEIINLGNPDERTVIEIAHQVKNLTHSTSPIVHKPLPIDDPTRRKPDISKAQKILNWRPKITLSDGLNRTIEYFQSL